tara:strand:- start:439 stop:2463 length:2025 start_codon:yes stop_codon:yes gene_type:complete
MKKIDFHIHTIPSVRDAHFVFSMDTLTSYVLERKLDAIAITNHDLFDIAQFSQIAEILEVPVFPGIEINMQSGHLLVIDDINRLEEFQEKADKIRAIVKKVEDYVTFDKLIEIYGDLGEYLVIPHYQKKPAISGDELNWILPYAFAGEVDSPKKFVRMWNDSNQPTPVLFSDMRIKENLTKFSSRSTSIDCGELTVKKIKLCLKDKAKVLLSPKDGNKLFEALPNGQMISTGLNVVLGGRSTGKTVTLEKIAEQMYDPLHIEQFDLVQKEEELDKRLFEEAVTRDKSHVEENHLRPFKEVVDSVLSIDIAENEKDVSNYIATLMKSASETALRDTFSNTALFEETTFPVTSDDTLKALIRSVQQLIANADYKKIIEKYVDRSKLRELACELIEERWRQEDEISQKTEVNSLINEIKQELDLKSAVAPISSVDLYGVTLDQIRIDRFTEIVKLLKFEKDIHDEKIQNFRVVAKRSPFKGAQELHDKLARQASFSAAFSVYNDPYRYLQELKCISALPKTEIYKYFAKTDYKILNNDGIEVSGGERSEFRLVQKIKRATVHDILLIDEPESGFDNIFLKSNVNQIIKDLSKTLPVVIVTHNSTIGASIGADYFLHTSKEYDDGKAIFKIYSGYPADTYLTSIDGASIENYSSTINALEAGADAYKARNEFYENIKN